MGVKTGRVDSNQGFLNRTGAKGLGRTITSGSSLGLGNLSSRGMPSWPGLVRGTGPGRGCSVGASSEPVGLCGTEGASAPCTNEEDVAVTGRPAHPPALLPRGAGRPGLHSMRSCSGEEWVPVHAVLALWTPREDLFLQIYLLI